MLSNDIIRQAYKGKTQYLVLVCAEGTKQPLSLELHDNDPYDPSCGFKFTFTSPNKKTSVFNSTAEAVSAIMSPQGIQAINTAPKPLDLETLTIAETRLVGVMGVADLTIATILQMEAQK